MGQIVPYFLIDRRAMGEEEEEKGRNRPATARFCPAAVVVDINCVTLNFLIFVILHVYYIVLEREAGSSCEEDDVKLLLLCGSAASCLGGKNERRNHQSVLISKQ